VSLSPTPLVSVLINNYNYAQFLPEAIDSVLNQEYPELEVVVVDDGSTDSSRAIIEKHAALNSRIIPVFKSNGGQASAYNAGVATANGEILCFLDSDDVWLPGKIRAIVDAHRLNPFLHHPVMRNGKMNIAIIPPPFDYRELLMKYGFLQTVSPSSALSLRRDLADMIFPIPERSLKLCADLYITLAATIEAGVYTLPGAYTDYRIHENNRWESTSNSQSEKVRGFLNIVTLMNQKLDSRKVSRIPIHDTLQRKAMYGRCLGICKHQQWYVYGVGTLGLHVAEVIRSHKGRVKAFVDSSPERWGTSMGGLDVLSPKELQTRMRADDRVVIGSSFVSEIMPMLDSLGLQRNQIFVPPMGQPAMPIGSDLDLHL
jgi:glycosyltransferase involved in cell wall biosynthesis